MTINMTINMTMAWSQWHEANGMKPMAWISWIVRNFTDKLVSLQSLQDLNRPDCFQGFSGSTVPHCRIRWGNGNPSYTLIIYVYRKYISIIRIYMPRKYILLPPTITLKRHHRKKKKKTYLQVLNPRCVPSQRHEPSHDKLRRALGWRLPCWTPVSTNVQRLKIFQGTTRAPCKHKQFSTGCLTLDLQAFKPIASLTLINFIITAYAYHSISQQQSIQCSLCLLSQSVSRCV